MNFAISVGTFKLLSFAELQLRSLRNIFGYTTPILVYDGASDVSQKVKDLADRYECSYVTEENNRSHFAGCLLNSVCSVAFAQHVGASLAIKLNQRLLLLSDDIPERFEEVFSNSKIDIAMPPTVRPETIYDHRSRFHAKFRYMPDCIVIRANRVNPQWIADSYGAQVKNGTTPHDALTEAFWQRQVDSTFKDRFAPLTWLSEPTDPPIYLRKIQHRESDYQKAAVDLGMTEASFPCAEWNNLAGAAYRPAPRAV